MENEAEPNDLLRDARIQHHWTQQDLAAKLEVSKDAVRSWEHGRRSPSLEQRAKLCDLFAMSPAELGLESKQRDTVLSELYSDTTPSNLPRMRVNRHRMIGHVKAVWIEGVREQMLHQTTPIMLTLQERPDALANPWGSVMQETNLPSRTLPPDTSLAQVYDEANGNLLLLGEPGAGKTTLLLDLARVLLKRAEQNEHHPLPVIFHLAEWAVKQQPLAVWLVEELSTKYHVPRLIGQGWIDQEQLIFLLDGLDEVAPASRPACMRAIEAYQTDQHPLASVVVCCRLVEYYKMPARLTKGRAIALQPLTVEQIDRYLAGAGTPLKMMRRALDQNADLLELVKNPLMLSIVTQVYRDKEAVLLQGSLDLLKQQIFRSYVQRMLSRRAADNRYSQEQIVHWLSWLAMQMQQRNQSEFYVERMQPDLLPVSLRQRYYRTAVQVVCGLESLVLATTLAWLRGGKVTPTLGGVGGGLFGELGGGLGNTVLGWMWPGLGLGGLGGGGVVSLVFALVAVLVGMMIDTGRPRPPLSRHQVRLGITRGIRYGLICAGLVWLFCLLLFGLRGGISSGLTYGSSFGVLTGLIVGPLSGLTVSLRQRKLSFSPRKSLRAKISRMGDGIIPGICALLGFWIVNALLKLQDGFVYGFVVAFFFYAVYSFGKADERMSISADILPAEMVLWSWANVKQSLPKALARGGLIGLSTFASVAVCFGLVSGIARGPAYGIAYGLVFGPVIGVSVGMAGLLSGVLNSGWESDILQEHSLTRPNEGIRRSWHNAVIAAALLGSIGGVMSGMVCGISFGLIGQLPGWPVLAGGFAIAFGIIFSFYFLMIRGGIAFLEHYLLRYHLWRTGVLPLRYVRFLNYAASRILLRSIGGGYMFVHRLFLDYFASGQQNPDRKGKNEYGC